MPVANRVFRRASRDSGKVVFSSSWMFCPTASSAVHPYIATPPEFQNMMVRSTAHTTMASLAKFRSSMALEGSCACAELPSLERLGEGGVRATVVIPYLVLENP